LFFLARDLVETAGDKWKSYAAIALGNLPDGAGVPALIELARNSSGTTLAAAWPMVAERAVLLARSSRGVEFEASDGNPVNLCFLIVAPPTEHDPIYLQMLAQIVKAVRLAPVRKKILEAPDFEAIRIAIRAQLTDE